MKKIFTTKTAYAVAMLMAVAVWGTQVASPRDNKAAVASEVVDFYDPADSTAAEFFVSAPLSVFPTIDRMTRLDMIDYFEAGSTKPSRNIAGGECRVLSVSPESITFSSSDVSEYTLSLLPSKKANGQPIIMVVRTLKTPAEDSSAKFYSANWQELDGIFEVPVLNDWLNKAGKQQKKDVENAVPFVLAKMVYTPDNQTVTITNNIGDYLPEESLGVARESLQKQLTFRWNGHKFVALKQ